MAFFHVAAAIVALGGTFFVVVALAPGLSGQPFAPEVMRSAAKRFAPVIWAAIVVFILTGLHLLAIRYIVVSERVSSLHWLLIIAKILLAVVLIVHSLLITLPFKALESVQQKRLSLMRANLVLGLVVVALGVYLVRQHW